MKLITFVWLSSEVEVLLESLSLLPLFVEDLSINPWKVLLSFNGSVVVDVLPVLLDVKLPPLVKLPEVWCGLFTEEP